MPLEYIKNIDYFKWSYILKFQLNIFRINVRDKDDLSIHPKQGVNSTKIKLGRGSESKWKKKRYKESENHS